MVVLWAGFGVRMGVPPCLKRMQGLHSCQVIICNFVRDAFFVCCLVFVQEGDI